MYEGRELQSLGYKCIDDLPPHMLLGFKNLIYQNTKLVNTNEKKSERESAKEESNSEYLDDLFVEELSSAKNLLQIIQDYESEKFIESESKKLNDKKIEFMSK